MDRPFFNNIIKNLIFQHDLEDVNKGLEGMKNPIATALQFSIENKYEASENLLKSLPAELHESDEIYCLEIKLLNIYLGFIKKKNTGFSRIPELGVFADKILILEKESLLAIYISAMIHYERKQFNIALNLFQHLLNYVPDNQWVLLHLVMINLVLKSYQLVEQYKVQFHSPIDRMIISCLIFWSKNLHIRIISILCLTLLYILKVTGFILPISTILLFLLLLLFGKLRKNSLIIIFSLQFLVINIIIFITSLLVNLWYKVIFFSK